MCPGNSKAFDGFTDHWYGVVGWNWWLRFDLFWRNTTASFQMTTQIEGPRKVFQCESLCVYPVDMIRLDSFDVTKVFMSHGWLPQTRKISLKSDQLVALELNFADERRVQHLSYRTMKFLHSKFKTERFRRMKFHAKQKTNKIYDLFHRREIDDD